MAILTEHTGWRGAAVSFSHDGAVLASSSRKSIQLWDVRKRVLLLESAPQPNWSGSIQFAPKEPLFAVPLKDGSVQLWNLDKVLQHAAAKKEAAGKG